MRRLVALLPLVLAAPGCSLTTYDYAPCSEHAECRDAFGFGYVCGDEGLCAEAAVDARCDTTWPPDLFERPENYRDVIPLGAMAAGPSSTMSAVELAVRQVNDADGLDGRDFALVTCTYEESYDLDDLDKAAATEHVTRHLADELGVPAIVGPSTSTLSEVAYAVAAPLGTLLISPSATSPSLETIDGVDEKTDEAPGLFWRTVPPDSLQGKVVARDMSERAIRHVAAVYVEDSYGVGLVNVFDEDFRDPQHILSTFPYTGDWERAEAIQQAADAGAEEILFIASTADDVVAFFNSASEAGVPPSTGIFLTDTARNDTVLDEAGEAIEAFERVRGTAPALPEGDVYALFATTYVGAYGEAPDSVYAAHAWDAAWLAFLGVAWAEANEDGITGIGIARGLRKVSETGQDGEGMHDLGQGSWEAIRARFAAGQSVDIHGATGKLDFDSDTEETAGPVEVWYVEDGAFWNADTVYPL